jgi:hypothetical protein
VQSAVVADLADRAAGQAGPGARRTSETGDAIAALASA